MKTTDATGGQFELVGGLMTLWAILAWLCQSLWLTGLMVMAPPLDTPWGFWWPSKGPLWSLWSWSCVLHLMDRADAAAQLADDGSEIGGSRGE